MTRLRPSPVEATLVTYLSPRLGVHVGTRVPEKRPATHVRVTRTGGGRGNLVQENPTVLVECWAADSVAAEQLAVDAWSWLDALNTGASIDWLHRVELTSPVNLPDPDTNLPRYQFVAQLTANLEVIDA